MSYSLKNEISDFFTGFTIETTPGAAAKIADYRDHLRPGTLVYITFLPGSNFADTIAVAERLTREGLIPVPHIAARSLPSRDLFEGYLKELKDKTNLDRVLCIGGGVAPPLGEFSETMQVLETGLLEKYGIKHIGVAGHPEGSPDISDEAIAGALKLKNDFAERSDAELYLVTQFCFEAEPLIKWDKVLQASGNRLPIHIGIPGLATLRALIGHAKACGVGASMGFLTKQARSVAKLLNVSAPDKLVLQLARYHAEDRDCGIAGVHVFPLGGLKKSARWSYGIVDGDFNLNPKSDGFDVHFSDD